jgi:rhodanese-related sulfurtransferase
MNIIDENKQQFAKLKKAIDKKDIEWYAIPIILYCKNKNCKASDHCLEELTKKGIVNIKIFRGGIDEYHKEINVCYKKN